ncbi:hypothetical protein [Chryseobacterium echinoideorum]|uniref:hypothetical protein n=1 Tax=Chryseobacterium echinoideorum TaxID=1549648 RepID=UPI001186EA2C|nr:hypothetical protein [Chryseobacterium echinoideorum]
MIKIIISIVAVYLLYYSGNIVYDLFLKKDYSGKKEETEEYLLIGFSEKNTNKVQEVRIDDVENIKTPNSFNKKEVVPSVQEEQQNDSRDLDYIRRKFESEQEIDDFYNVSEVHEKVYEMEQNETLSRDSQQEKIIKEQEKKDISSPNLDSLNKQFKNFINLAETNVQVISSLDGYKVYQSLI